MKTSVLTGLSLFALLGLGARASAAPNQVLALDVTGSQVNGGKVRRCEDVARRHGFILSPQAPIRVMLQLNAGYNRLVVTSQRRGPVIDAPKPGWGMDQLCEDAMQNAESAYMNDGQAPVQQPTPLPPQQYQPQYPAQQYAPPPQQYGTSPQVIALDVTGPASSPDKQQRCVRVAQRRGIGLNPSSPFRVTLVLQNGYNRLQITGRHGELYSQPKPGWGMEQLCEDALNQAQMSWSQDNQPPRAEYAPPQPQAPQPPKHNGYALGPIPPSKELPPNVRALADGGVKAWQGAQFEAALTAFREAHHAGGDPQFLFDQAVCEQRLGRFSEALSHTQQYLDKAPQSAYRPYADQLFGELQAAMGNE